MEGDKPEIMSEDRYVNVNLWHFQNIIIVSERLETDDYVEGYRRVC